MASQSRDELQCDSARADSAGDSECPTPAAEADPSAVPAGQQETPPADTLVVEDEELIEMLEQLNETLDTARIALSEHQTIAGVAGTTTSTTVAMATGAAGEPPPRPQRQSLVRPMLAAALGMCIGAGGLAMLWPAWTSRQQTDLQAGPAESWPRETHIPRSMQVAPPSGGEIAAVPLPDPKPALKLIQERVPATAPRLEAGLPSSPRTTPPPPDVAAATAAAPAALAAMLDKPDFEEKDESNSMPLPEQASRVAALPKRPAPPVALTPEEEKALLARGDTFLDNGDFASARLVYEHAAARGSAEAMFALARSYDPRFLTGGNAVGIKPDRKLALDWYARAAQKGHDQADAMASELERSAAR